jgi:hypothetical protein
MKKLLTILLFIFCIKGYSQEISYVITSQSANLRSQPNTKSKIIGTLTFGEIVGGAILEENTEWIFVTYYGNEGYINTRLLKPLDDHEQYKKWSKINAKTGDAYNCENIQPEFDTQIDNSLNIRCGFESDVIVKLMNLNDVCVRISYIRSGESYSMKNIPLGTYYLKTAYGRDYRQSVENDQCVVKFLRNPIYNKADQLLKFSKNYKGKTIEGNKEITHYEFSYYNLELNLNMKTSLMFNKDKLLTSKISEKEFNN